MKYLFPALALVLTPLVCRAQKAPVQDPAAAEVLAGMAKRYKAYKAFAADFTRTTVNAAGKPIEQDKGTVTVAGPKFRIETEGLKLFCDGKTLYTYVLASKEVNITTYEPDPAEITPVNVFDIYKQGYKYMLAAQLKTPTGFVDVIDLEPEDITKDISKVRLVVAKKTFALRRYILTERGTNNRSTFTIERFLPNPKVSASTFVFDKKKHPGVKKVVDLR